MGNTYAQVIKESMRVNLIGGKEEGLPIEHPSVFCVNISGRDDVEINMKYDHANDIFYHESFPETDPVPLTPTLEDRLMAMEEALLMIL